MGRKLELDWQETASELKKRYCKERNSERKTRLHAFWQLRLGKTMKDVAELVGMTYRTVQNWVAWYRHGGLAELLKRIKGHGHQGRPAKLKTLQQKALAAKVALGHFRNVWDVIQWVRDRWKIHYSYSGLLSRLKDLKCRLKVPRPRSVKADVEAQEEWKSTGLTEALRELEMSPSHHIWFSDEMRFGLWGQTRKRWGLRGVPIIQPIQIEFEWQYLVLAIDVVRCKLYWAWADRMNQTNLIPIFRKWMPDAVIWDGASAHRGKAMSEVGFERIFLLPYSPELNPCERVFEWLRAKIEGEVYKSLQHKRRVIEHYLRRLSCDKYSLRKLVYWKWIQQAFEQLAESI
jgi:putative transposase